MFTCVLPGIQKPPFHKKKHKDDFFPRNIYYATNFNYFQYLALCMCSTGQDFSALPKPEMAIRLSWKTIFAKVRSHVLCKQEIRKHNANKKRLHHCICSKIFLKSTLACASRKFKGLVARVFNYSTYFYSTLT